MKTEVRMFSLLAAVLLPLFWPISQAGAAVFADSYEVVSLNTAPFYLAPGETKTIFLPGREWRYLRSLSLQASGYRGNATFEVLTNGDVKGVIQVSSSQAFSGVNIGEMSASIQVRNLCGTYVYMGEFQATVAARTVPVPAPAPFPFPVPMPGNEGPSTSFPSYNEATRIALEAIRLVDILEDFSNYTEYGVYLLPIKKRAALAYAAAAARGSIGQEVHRDLVALKAQIDFAQAFLDETFERDNAFEAAVRLKSLSDRLAGMLL